jgi:hypothetical protein
VIQDWSGDTCFVRCDTCFPLAVLDCLPAYHVQRERRARGMPVSSPTSRASQTPPPSVSRPPAASPHTQPQLPQSLSSSPPPPRAAMSRFPQSAPLPHHPSHPPHAPPRPRPRLSPPARSSGWIRGHTLSLRPPPNPYVCPHLTRPPCRSFPPLTHTCTPRCPKDWRAGSPCQPCCEQGPCPCPPDLSEEPLRRLRVRLCPSSMPRVPLTRFQEAV